MTKFFNIREPLDARVFWALCAAVCLIGFAFRLPTLASRSLWLDETYSAWFSAIPLHELWTSVPLYETHPPMYYTLLKAWSHIFGTSEAALRSMSVLASVATIFVLTISGRILRAGVTGDKVALVAALFLAVNRGNIEYAQQARPYGIETLFAAIAILFSIRLLRQLALPSSEAPTLRTLACSIIGLALAGGYTLWLHNTAIFIAFGIWAGLILSLLTTVRGNRWIQAQAIAIPGVLALLIWSPFVPMLMRQSANVSKMHYWIYFQHKDILSAWYLAAGGEKAIVPVALLSILGAFFLWRRERTTAVHFLTVLLLPLAIVLIYSHSVKAIYISRLFEWLAPPLLALAALGVMAGLRRPLYRAGAVLVVVVLSTYTTTQFYKLQTEDWRGLVNTISTKSEPGDILIVIPNEVNVPIKYYAESVKKFPDVQYVPAAFPALDLDMPYVGNLGAPAVVPADKELVNKVMSTHHRVWLMTRKADMYDRAGIVRSEVAASHKLVGSYGTTGIVLELFE